MKKSSNNKIEHVSPNWLNTIWGAIIAGCSLLAIGYGFGIYTSKIFHKIEINEINQEHNQQLYNLKTASDSKLTKVEHEKRVLEIENCKFKTDEN